MVKRASQTTSDCLGRFVGVDHVVKFADVVAGHVALLSIETFLLSLAFNHLWSAHAALSGALAVGLCLVMVFELAQMFVPDRGAALPDLGANTSGVTLFGVVGRSLKNTLKFFGDI